MLFRLSVLVATLSLMACSTPSAPPPPYVPPDAAQPHALLTIVPKHTRVPRHGAESLQRTQLTCEPGRQRRSLGQDLARWNGGQETTSSQLRLPVGRNHFSYFSQQNQRYCSASFSAMLEPGHAYVFEARTDYKGFLQQPGCSMIMLDSTTGVPVPIEMRNPKEKTSRWIDRECAALPPADQDSNSAASAPAPVLVIKPTPGGEVCSQRPPDGSALTLCVTMGTFAHDVYRLKLDGRVILEGIDDATTTGVTTVDKGRAWQLRCTPKNIFPKESPEETLAEVRRQLPNATAAEAAKLAALLGPGPSPMGIELGRDCVATDGGKPVLEAQVVFD